MQHKKKAALNAAMQRIKKRQFMLDKIRMLEAPASFIEMSEIMLDEAKKAYAALLDDQSVSDDIGSVIYNADILLWSRQLIEEFLEYDHCKALFHQIMDCSAGLTEKLIASKGLAAEWHKVNDEKAYDRTIEIIDLIDAEFGNRELIDLINQWESAVIDTLTRYLCFHASR